LGHDERRLVGIALCGLLLTGVATAFQSSAAEPALTRAESLLVRGDLEPAREILESYLRDHDDNVRALILLGRVYLEWPVIGRFKALGLFTQAGRMTPDDPEPHYWAVQVGARLGGADGEAMARASLYRVWARAPDYRDTWETWRRLYRGREHRRDAVAVLERHVGVPVADVRRAELLIELEQCAAADSLLGVLITRDVHNGSLWALRAQAALEVQDTTRGLELYREAVQRAASDTAGVLWQQIAPIASPAEDSAYAETPPTGRAPFLRAFWARREPDLTTPMNERILEHFARIRHARVEYPILHPLRRFHRSPISRALGAVGQSATVAISGAEFGLRGRDSYEDTLRYRGFGPSVLDVHEPIDTLTRYARYGLDGRGLMYLRFGEPSDVDYDAFGGVEIWHYRLGGGWASVTFARSSGDWVLHPSTRGQVLNTNAMLRTDSSSLRTQLSMQAWIATFRGIAWNEHEVLLGTEPRQATAARWENGGWIERHTGTAPFRFIVRAGHHQVRADARRDGRLGRVSRTVDVPWYWGDRLALSSILVGRTTDSAFSRDDVAGTMPADLRFPIREPLALYAEIYNLPADETGRARYDVIYTFEPADDGVADVTFSFVRHRRAAQRVEQRLVVEPGELPRGRYRIRVTVRDRVLGREVEQTRVDVELR
jgi:hypothetical protein